jgi:hypothetical protein
MSGTEPRLLFIVDVNGGMRAGTDHGKLATRSGETLVELVEPA